MRFVQRQPRGAQGCVLPSGNERTKIVVAGRAGGSLVTAATLSFGIEQIERFIAITRKEGILIAEMMIDSDVATIVVQVAIKNIEPVVIDACQVR